MKQKVKKTFYANRNIYVIGQSYETEAFSPEIVKEYFEEVTKPAQTTKKKVRKPKSEPKKVEAKKEQKEDKAPAEAREDVESVEAPATADKEAEISVKDED